MKSKSIGAVLLILGTSIGAGMVALPVAAAQENFFISLALLFLSWLVMSFGAFALLEATLWFGKDKNIVSIAKATLGVPGQVLTWIIYLFLLYSLLCAYISGISDVVHVILWGMGLHSPHWLEIILSVIILGAVIYHGIRCVDFLNRGLMSVKFIIYLVIAVVITGNINPVHLTDGSSAIHLSTVMVMISSFGYAIIIPSLVDYLDRDAPLIRKVVLIGSFIPIIIYALWIAIIQGVIPRSELIQIASNGRTVAELISAMQHYTGTAWLAIVANVFMSICAFTSFLGVSLSLVDFLADGINVNKRSGKGWIVYVLTFLPPLLIVMVDPNIFVKALSYAGIFCVILLIILPLAMVLAGRYWRQYHHDFRVPGGWLSLIIGLGLGMVLVVMLIAQGA
jgi:tyrosine-specific transport protein